MNFPYKWKRNWNLHSLFIFTSLCSDNWKVWPKSRNLIALLAALVVQTSLRSDNGHSALGTGYLHPIQQVMWALVQRAKLLSFIKLHVKMRAARAFLWFQHPWDWWRKPHIAGHVRQGPKSLSSEFHQNPSIFTQILFTISENPSERAGSPC